MGMYSKEEGLSKCDMCAKGYYAASDGMTACAPCQETFTTDSQGSGKPEDCVCPAGMYRNPGDDICVSCIEGIGCPGGNDVPTQEHGYYVEVVDAKALKLDVFFCALREWCPQGSLSTCQYAREGRACARIVASDDPCPIWFYPLFGIIALAAVYALYRGLAKQKFGAVHTRSQGATMATLLICAMQAINVHFLFYDEVPANTVSLDTASEPFSFKLDMFAPQCNAGQTFPARLSMPLVPVLFVGVALSSLILASFLCKNLIPDAFAVTADNALNAYGGFLQLLFLTLCKGSFGFFCQKSNPSPISTLRDFTDVIYGSDTHLAPDAVLIQVLLLVVCLATISSFWYTIRVAPNRIANDSFRAKTKFLIGRFRPGCQWWGLAVILRNVAIALVPIIVVSEQLLSVQLFTLLIVAYFGVQIKYMPWPAAPTNVYDALSCILVCFVAMCGCGHMRGNTPSQKVIAAASMYTAAALIAVLLFVCLAYYVVNNSGAKGKAKVTRKVKVANYMLNTCVKISSRVDTEEGRTRWTAMLIQMQDYDYNVLEETAKFINDGTTNSFIRIQDVSKEFSADLSTNFEGTAPTNARLDSMSKPELLGEIEQLQEKDQKQTKQVAQLREELQQAKSNVQADGENGLEVHI